MTREEAIKQIREAMPTLWKETKDAIQTLIPELKESEDEKFARIVLDLPFKHEADYKFVRAYLEKQKEQTEELPVRLNGLMQEYVKEGKDEEEQEHRLKCYQLFWDALGDSEIFKKKEQNDDAEDDTDFTIYHPLKNGKGEYKCIPYSFYGSLTSFSENKDLIDFLRTCFYTEEECNKWIEQQKEQRPSILCGHENDIEWSEEDEKMSYFVNQFLEYHEASDPTAKSCKEWFNNRLKSLRPSWKPSEEQMGALNYAYGELFKRGDVGHNILGPLQKLIDQLNKLM